MILNKIPALIRMPSRRSPCAPADGVGLLRIGQVGGAAPLRGPIASVSGCHPRLLRVSKHSGQASRGHNVTIFGFSILDFGLALRLGGCDSFLPLLSSRLQSPHGGVLTYCLRPWPGDTVPQSKVQNPLALPSPTNPLPGKDIASASSPQKCRRRAMNQCLTL